MSRNEEYVITISKRKYTVNRKDVNKNSKDNSFTSFESGSTGRFPSYPRNSPEWHKQRASEYETSQINSNDTFGAYENREEENYQNRLVAKKPCQIRLTPEEYRQTKITEENNYLKSLPNARGSK